MILNTEISAHVHTYLIVSSDILNYIQIGKNLTDKH